MKFNVSTTSCRVPPYEGAKCMGKDQWDNEKWIIEVNSLEELLAVSDKSDCSIIVQRGEEENYIEIYDGYRE